MGGWIIAAAALVSLVVAFGSRRKLPAPVVAVLLALSSAALAWGGLDLRADPSAGERVLAVAAMALLGPLHVRIVLGRFGPRRTWSR